MFCTGGYDESASALCFSLQFPEVTHCPHSMLNPSIFALPQMGSSSVSHSSTHCLHGLKFGHKIYFEDVTVGAQPKSTAVGRSSSSGTGMKKGRGGTAPGAQPPRCQVEGCKVDLSDAKAYYSRHKVCGFHSKCPKVIVAGLEQRFCQQCSRFHQLIEFDQEKRSCRRRLAGHNERRRKPQPSSLMISPYARYSSAVHDNRGRVGRFEMEFAADLKPTLRNLLQAPTSMEQVAGHPLQGNLQATEFRNTLGECFAGIADTSRALSLLSNQTWGPINTPPALGVNNLCFGGTPTTQLAASSYGAPIHHLSNALGSFKSIDEEVVRDLGADQISLFNSEHTCELVMPQSGRRQYIDRVSEAYEFSQLMHWSL